MIRAAASAGLTHMWWLAVAAAMALACAAAACAPLRTQAALNALRRSLLFWNHAVMSKQ